VNPQYSIVIPAYNESARIGGALAEVLRTLDAKQWNAEVLVVNDGSSDDTAAIVNSFAAKDGRVKLLQNGVNRGKGYSVRNGLLHASGNILMFTDADLSSPMVEAERLFDAIRDGADVAIGSRWLQTSRQTIHQPLYRQFFGRCFNVVTRMIMRLPFADTQCGFKAFRRGAAQTIFQLQRIERWGFDPEILFLARKFGFRVEEVAVFWGHSGDTRIHPLVDGARMFWEMVRIRWYDVTGKYEGGPTVGARAVKTLPGGPGSGTL
jgi:glycosyltransferase involved in cell wall biosynthesis